LIATTSSERGEKLLFGSAKRKSWLFLARGGASRAPIAFTSRCNSFTRTEFVAGSERYLRVRAEFNRSDWDKS
jgi:hypothetical protein